MRKRVFGLGKPGARLNRRKILNSLKEKRINLAWYCKKPSKNET